MYGRAILLLLAACLWPVAAADAASKLKIGVLITETGPGAVQGRELKDAFELGLDHVGRRIGGLETEVIYGDDQLKVDVVRQAVEKFLKSDKVDIVAGVIWSNVMLAVYPIVMKSGTFLIGTNAGPSQIAGAQCNENFFTTSWQNDNAHEVMGRYMSEQKVDGVAILALNYQAGHDKVAGFKRFFKGKILGEDYTPLDQLDFAAELASLRAKGPAALYAWYPGGQGIQFVRQYAQAGLMGKIPLYSAEMIDDTTVPALGETALGIKTVSFWAADLKNPENERFVAGFLRKYGRGPSAYAAQTYDAVMLLDSALKAVGGGIEDKGAFRAALKRADFKSVRGKFRYNNNHFPIEDWYLVEAAKAPDGHYLMKLDKRLEADHEDAYHGECKLE
jgi:branched-chain amino acid transport system substrate-binding protein